VTVKKAGFVPNFALRHSVARRRAKRRGAGCKKSVNRLITKTVHKRRPCDVAELMMTGRPPGRVALVAVIDGNARRRHQIAAALLSLYRVHVYPDADRALPGLRADPPDVLLVDEQTPPHDGFAFIRTLRWEPSFARTPIIVTTKASEAALAQWLDQCGADAAVTRPYRRSVLVKAITALRNRDVERAWEEFAPTQRAALNGTVQIFNTFADTIATGETIAFSRVTDACRPLVEAIAQNDFRRILAGVKHHDNYSYVHSLRVATLLALFGQAASLRHDDQLLLASGGLLHDVGKLTVPHEVLNKPGRLDPGEVAVMQRHVSETVSLLRAIRAIPGPIITIAEQHHEKLDGTGYPHGLASAQLNELARMAAIVDVFSALTDRRIYKPSIPAEKALAIMSGQMADHLDQHFLSLFRTMLLDAVA
jgi:putative nucleotidyltransferase with HDIG domain